MKKIFLLMCFALLLSSAIVPGPEKLKLDVFVADDDGWDVTSTIIYGKTESILIDTQLFQSRAAKVADRIAATGTHLKAIIITHPHDDHYMGIATLHQRFPGTPIYMPAEDIPEFKRTADGVIGWFKKNIPSEAPDSVPTPEVLPTTHFKIDGQDIELKQGQGDEWRATNDYIWIPSLRAIIAGDMVFNQVHPWLATSNEQSIAAWAKSLETLSALHPAVVVAGHKKSGDLKDTPDAIAFTSKYLQDYEVARKASTNAEELVAAIKAKYPDAGLSDKILWQTAKKAFAK